MSVRALVLVLSTCLAAIPTASAQPAGPPSSPAPAAPQAPVTPDPHAGHVMPATSASPAPDPHAGHDMSKPQSDAATTMRPPFIPPVTDEMRAAAFPDVQGHAAHDRHVNGFVLVEQLEWRSGHGPGGVAFSSTGWVGGDINRLWFRTEGDGADGDVEEAEAHVLYGRAIARWWDVVGGVRLDMQPGVQTWFAVGLQGVAPGFFDVDVTAYLSDEGQAAARLALGYDLLLTNRLVLQPTLELNVYGKANPSLGVGGGLSTGEAGIRLRYQIRREIAPYVGVSWVKAFDDSAQPERPDAVPNGAPRLVTGVRVWF